MFIVLRAAIRRLLVQPQDVKLALDDANNQRVPNHKVAADVQELAIEDVCALPRGRELLLEVDLQHGP